MEKYKQEFIEFMVDCGVLKFGDFVTKERKKDSVFREHRSSTATGSQLRKTRRVLRESNQ